MGAGWGMGGWHLGSGRSLVCMDEGGKDAVLLAEQLLWLVELQDGTAFQDNHQVCAQDGVHTVLGQAGGEGQGGGGMGGAAEGTSPAARRRRHVARMSSLSGDSPFLGWL